MKQKFIVLVLILSLGGCTAFQRFESEIQSLTSATVTPQQISIAAQSFDGVQVTTARYFDYCRTRLSESACSAENRRVVIKDVRAGRAARNQLETYLASGANAPKAIYNTLLAVIDSISNSSAVKVSQ